MLLLRCAPHTGGRKQVAVVEHLGFFDLPGIHTEPDKQDGDWPTVGDQGGAVIGLAPLAGSFEGWPEALDNRFGLLAGLPFGQSHFDFNCSSGHQAGDFGGALAALQGAGQDPADASLLKIAPKGFSFGYALVCEGRAGRQMIGQVFAIPVGRGVTGEEDFAHNKKPVVEATGFYNRSSF
jgi:hypothetical protein